MDIMIGFYNTIIKNITIYITFIVIGISCNEAHFVWLFRLYFVLIAGFLIELQDLYKGWMNKT